MSATTARRGGLAVYEHPPVVDLVVHDPPPRVVLVHGSLDRAAAFLRSVRHLRHLEVVRYDRRGYGRSLDAGTSEGIDALVDDLVVVLDGRPSVVVGHSLGGVVALAAAQRHPELVSGVGAFEAPAAWFDWWPGGSAGSRALARGGDPGDVAERFFRALVGDDRWDALPDATKAVRRREGPALVADLRSIRGDAPYDPDRLASLGIPVALGYGTRSRPHHIRAASEVHDAIAGSELVVVDDAAHDAHASHPADFARMVDLVARRSTTTGPDRGGRP